MDFLNPKKSVTSTKDDVISKLPEELIYSILERLPIEDAVRTSVISKQWRYIWTTISCCDDFTPFQILHSNDLDTVHVSLLKAMINDVVQGVERFRLVMMLIKMSNIVSFAIDGYFLKFLGLEKSSKWLPHALKCVKKLEIESLNFGDFDQVQGALCMLRNSPNLEVFRVACMQMEPDADLELTSSYLESPDCLPQKMLRLHSVEITSLEGSKPELQFVKLLLNRSRHLEDMIIRPSATVDVERRLSVLKDIMFFPHASNKARIAFLE